MNERCHGARARIALANHLGVDPLAIEGRQSLEDDWGLDALDLAIIAMRLEDAHLIEIARVALDELRTVADFESLVRRAAVSDDDALGLGASVRPSLRETVRRSPRRARRSWMHRQLRRALRNHAA
jgi:acyl carrier protein